MVHPYTDSELKDLLSDLESDRAERKQSLDGSVPQSICEAVCAFSNDLAGRGTAGVVFVGATDAGGHSGFEVTDRALLQLANIKTDGNIVPPPSILVEKRRLLGQDYAVVHVWPCDTPPVRFKGRIHVRWGPRRGLATAQDERILNERRRYRDRPYDVQPLPSTTLQDLDRLRFEQEYLPSVVARDVLVANDRSLEQQLAATKMIIDSEVPTPTVLGVLVVGKSPADWVPGAYTQFLRLAGTDLDSPVTDEERAFGTVADQIRRIEEKLEAHNQRTIQFADLEVEARREEYSTEALRQLLRNAQMHRSYEATSAPVRVYWFADRIEIHNPGGPYGTVTLENFGQPGLTDYRNPNLAEALRALGFVQRFGAGISIARRALGARLRFEVQPGFVAAIIRKEAT